MPEMNLCGRGAAVATRGHTFVFNRCASLFVNKKAPCSKEKRRTRKMRLSLDVFLDKYKITL